MNKEYRVYSIYVDDGEINPLELSDEEFKEIAGGYYTLKNFEKAFNNEEVNTATDIIRIIKRTNKMITYKSNCPEITLKYKSGETKKVKINTSKDIVEFTKDLFNRDTIELVEEFLVVYLNRANNTIGWIRISQGGISGTVADPKLIFSTALIIGASFVILLHNHPSGNVQPSEHDIKLSKQCKQIGELLTINVLDSIIVTESGEYYSMTDEGII